jgi:hypothetical protein
MNTQSRIGLLLVSAAAVCSSLPAHADFVTREYTGSIESFQGGWGGNLSDIGQQITVDFSFDSNQQTLTFDNQFLILSAPITSAGIAGGVLGSGINLESGGPGTGTVAETTDITINDLTSTAITSADAPSPNFTGDVFGLSFLSHGITTTIDLIKNVFSDGRFDAQDSGSVRLENVSAGQGIQAPEIDPTSALSALTLLAGSLVIIRGRKFAKIQPV